ncbi:MAG: bifunctional adenosylcobinamide kinase/adenosylcobinamide-phosphate guanylyltransferase [Clostridiales bacterium]|nr:bifunctional adenosylcobinamide kinase/adenosylcobinamide-phosphate guanylyltransferase [Clostridiales bacterium]
MTFLIGGHGAGQMEYLYERMGYRKDQCSDLPESPLPVLTNFHLLAGKFSEKQLIEWVRKKEVVVTEEVGCGIVPIDPKERVFREEAGRISIAAAKEAKEVIRFVCGMPQWLKGGK